MSHRLFGTSNSSSNRSLVPSPRKNKKERTQPPVRPASEPTKPCFIGCEYYFDSCEEPDVIAHYAEQQRLYMQLQPVTGVRFIENGGAIISNDLLSVLYTESPL